MVCPWGSSDTGTPECDWASPGLGVRVGPWQQEGDPGPAVLPPAGSHLLWGSTGPPGAWSSQLLPREEVSPQHLPAWAHPIPCKWAPPMAWAKHSPVTGSCYFNVPETSSTELVFQLPKWSESTVLSRTCLKIKSWVLHVVLPPEGHCPHAPESSGCQLCHTSCYTFVPAPAAAAFPWLCVCSAPGGVGLGHSWNLQCCSNPGAVRWVLASLTWPLGREAGPAHSQIPVFQPQCSCGSEGREQGSQASVAAFYLEHENHQLHGSQWHDEGNTKGPGCQ